MRSRKFRIVADSCPFKRKNCDKCKYCMGYNGGDMKVYCIYGVKD